MNDDILSAEFLSDDERYDALQQIRVAIGMPPRAEPDASVPVLIKLVMEDLHMYALRCILEDQKRAGRQDREHAIHSLRVFRTELRDLLKVNSRIFRDTLIETWRWLNMKTSQTPTPERLVTYCADQLSAYLFYHNNYLNSHIGTACGVLLHRFTRKILLTRDIFRKTFFLRRPPQPEDILLCEEAVAEASIDFKFQGPDKAIKYFSEACYWALSREQKSLSDEKKHWELSLEHSEDWNQTQSTKDMAKSAEEKLWIKLDGPVLRYQRLMHFAFIQSLGRENAIILWVLAILRKEIGCDWEKIVWHITQPSCPVLDEMSLPPDTSWQEICLIFQTLYVSTKTSGRTVKETLQHFYGTYDQLLDVRYLAFSSLTLVMSVERALQHYILYILKEDRFANVDYYPNAWKPITAVLGHRYCALLSSQTRLCMLASTQDVEPTRSCLVLRDSDLPPGITWADVERAFAAITLNEGALKRRYNRDKVLSAGSLASTP